MSRKEAIALIGRFLQALNNGDVEAAVRLAHEDVVHDRDGGSREIGRKALRESLVRMQAETREELGDVVIMASDDGTRAAAEFTRRGRKRNEAGLEGAGQGYSIPGGMFFAIEDGAILRITPAGVFGET